YWWCVTGLRNCRCVRCDASSRSIVHSEQLLAHEQDISAGQSVLDAYPYEGAVRAAYIREVDLTVLLRSDATVQAGDVTVLRKQDMASVALLVYAALGDGKGVAGGVTANRARQAPDVPTSWAVEALHPVGTGSLRLERFDAHDFLTNPEDI